MNDDADLEWIGRQVLGRYRVVRRLAHGGMGVVYLGRLEGAAGFSKPVVIKRIISDSDDQQGNTARFIREAQILSNLQHPGIVGVLDFGEEDERYSMVLEYVNGYDLGRWLKYLQLKAQTMPWEEAVFITLRLLEALSYAHGFRRSDGSAAEILHRDISPGNVLLDLDGRVRLADFGIARMEATVDQFKTQTGVLKGKVAYLAPELFSGSPPSRASDIYACAVILYQMLAGANPFAAHNDSRVMWRVIMEGPSPLARQRDDLPPGLEALIFAAIDRDLLRRHDDAETFAAELRRVLTRSEAEIQDALREHVRGDFNGDMPALLRLETLSDRDRAWRQDLPAAEATRSIATQAPSSLVHSLTPATASEEPEPAAASEPQLTVRAERRAPPVPADGVTLPQVTTKRAAPSLSLEALVGLGLGMSVVIGLIVAAALFRLQQSSQPAGASRFIVVESPEQKHAEPSTAAAPLPAPSAEPSALPRPVNAGGDTPESPKNVRPTRPLAPDSSAALSQAFARRQGALTRCFEQHAREVEGRPEISVTFEVSPAGEVSSAGLAPAALEGTPLGRCLLDVARSTRFGALGKLTRFSIPIRASTVQR